MTEQATQPNPPIIDHVPGMPRPDALHVNPAWQDGRLDQPIGGIQSVNNRLAVEQRKAQMEKIQERAPETAEVLLEKDIVMLHGSNSATLLSVLEHGLLSGEEIRNRDLPANSGEWMFQEKTGQDSVSFAELDDVYKVASYIGSGVPRTVESIEEDIEATKELAERYKANLKGKIMEQRVVDRQAMLDKIKQEPDTAESQLILANLPVIWGVGNATATDHGLYARSGEYRIDGGLGPNELPVVAVPREWIGYVQQLVEHYGRDTAVVPVEDILFTKFDVGSKNFVSGQGFVPAE